MSLDHSRTAALAGIPNAGIQPELYQTPRVGLEQSSNNQVSDSITTIPKTGGAQSGAPVADVTDLNELIKAWPRLPKAVKRRIVALAGIESDTE